MRSLLLSSTFEKFLSALKGSRTSNSDFDAAAASAILSSNANNKYVDYPFRGCIFLTLELKDQRFVWRAMKKVIG